MERTRGWCRILVPPPLRRMAGAWLTYAYPIRWFNTLRYQARDARLRREGQPATGTGGEKVSILIPTLAKGAQASHLPRLERLLAEHLPRQTHANYEALVYCDGRNEAVEHVVSALADPRVRVLFTPKTLARWGHPQTRLGIAEATGEFFVRVNDDNHPYPDYLQTLVSGFADTSVGVVYGRVVFAGEARRTHSNSLTGSFVIPGDLRGSLAMGNVDCMNYMVRAHLARQYADRWDDASEADWSFLSALLSDRVQARFIDRIIGTKC
jgi:cellulose synthase/poly-beta-1,6-N-acetylglucosamine synthase-like glycosyltransferase